LFQQNLIDTCLIIKMRRISILLVNMKVKVEEGDDAAEEGEVVEKDDPKIIMAKGTITVLEEKEEIK